MKLLVIYLLAMAFLIYIGPRLRQRPYTSEEMTKLMAEASERMAQQIGMLFIPAVMQLTEATDELTQALQDYLEQSMQPY